MALHSRQYVQDQFQSQGISEHEKKSGGRLDPIFPIDPHLLLSSVKASLNSCSQANFVVRKTLAANLKRPTTVVLRCDKWRKKEQCKAYAKVMATDEGWMIVDFETEHNHDFEDSVAYYKVCLIFFHFFIVSCISYCVDRTLPLLPSERVIFYFTDTPRSLQIEGERAL